MSYRYVEFIHGERRILWFKLFSRFWLLYLTMAVGLELFWHMITGRWDEELLVPPLFVSGLGLIRSVLHSLSIPDIERTEEPSFDSRTMFPW